MVSADGDWRKADATIADSLRDHGIPSVGLKARSYLSGGKTPEQLATDLEAVTRKYLAEWGRTGIVFVGYSRGADVGPFALSRWPADLRDRVRLVVLVSPGTAANFRFHKIDLLRDVHRTDDRPLLPEVRKLEGMRILCIWGMDDADSLCPEAPDGLVVKLPWPGGHRVGGSPVPARMILDELAESGLIRR
jgi:type IV secretory pathway VirJ component